MSAGGRRCPPLVEILEVASPAPRSESLAGFAFDRPAVGDRNESSYAIEIEGWAVGKETPVSAVEIVHGDLVLWRAPVELERADVADAHPGVPHARHSGFYLPVGALDFPLEFEFRVRAQIDSVAHAELARVRGRRAPLHSDFEPRLQPLMVTTPGRTGSRALLRLLAGHPENLVYRPTMYEPRAATYWMDVLRTLAEPASYLRQVTPGAIDFTERGWWLGRQTPSPRGIPDADIQGWLGAGATADLASVCQGRIEAFYDRVAANLQRPDASYFVEKFAVRSAVPDLVWELYPRARELILVRDFRDLVASILAMNVKVGYQGFGRRRAASDVEFIERQMADLASAFVRTWRERSDRAHLVRYEDLVTSRGRTVEGILEYLDLDASAAAVAAMNQSLDERVPEMEGHGTSAGPEASVGRWRQDLSPELQELCNTAFGPALEAFGYSAEGDRTSGRASA
jgi:hypothetical protein